MEIAFENGRISDFQGLVTLTLDRVILHTVMHHSSTCTNTPNFIKIKEMKLFVDGRTDIETYFIGRLERVDLIIITVIVIIIMPLYVISHQQLHQLPHHHHRYRSENKIYYLC